MNKLLLPASGVPLVLGLNIAGNSPGTTDFSQDQNTKRQTEKQFLNPKDLNVPGGFTHVVKLAATA